MPNKDKALLRILRQLKGKRVEEVADYILALFNAPQRWKPEDHQAWGRVATTLHASPRQSLQARACPACTRSACDRRPQTGRPAHPHSVYLTSVVVGLQCGSESLVVRRNPMAKTVVRARIDETIKDEAAAVLAAMGLTVSDAFRLLLVRIAREKALPFEPLVPNAETIEAMKAARRGDLVTVGSVDQLFADLHADD
jgi:DNA-damage-inducible protein J